MDAWESDDGGVCSDESPAHFTLVIASAAAAGAPLPLLPPGAGVSIPELDLALAPGSRAAAGAATPAALLAAVRADLGGRRVVGGNDADAAAEWAAFWERFEAAEAGRAPWTLVVGGEEG